MSTANSSPRRVLGSKSTNKFLQVRTSNTSRKIGHSQTPTKSAKVAVTSSPPPSHGVESSPRTGQKRRREDIEEIHPQPQSQCSVLNSAPFTEAVSDSASERDEAEEDMTGSSMAQSKSAATPSTVMTSFHASQEPPHPIEETFEIQEEIMSQQTLEKIHAVKFSQGTSQLAPLLRPTLATEPSQDSIRMSSFIDFDEEETPKAEEEDDGLNMIRLPPRNSSPKSESDDQIKAAGKTDFAEKAETLRTRLQLALYKVQTNQAGRPFSRLQKPRSASPDLPDLTQRLTPTLIARDQASSSSAATLRGGGGVMSPESRIAIARARSSNMNQYKPAVRPLGSLAVPVMRPGPYSARCMEGEGADEDKFNRQGRQPKTPRREALVDGEQESGTWSVTASRTGRVIMAGFGGLTSSVIKGEAANGLLELRRAAGGIGPAGLCGV